jgi:hypothetical protein
LNFSKKVSLDVAILSKSYVISDVVILDTFQNPINELEVVNSELDNRSVNMITRCFISIAANR